MSLITVELLKVMERGKTSTSIRDEPKEDLLPPVVTEIEMVLNNVPSDHHDRTSFDLNKGYGCFMEHAHMRFKGRYKLKEEDYQSMSKIVR